MAFWRLIIDHYNRAHYLIHCLRRLYIEKNCVNGDENSFSTWCEVIDDAHKKLNITEEVISMQIFT